MDQNAHLNNELALPYYQKAVVRLKALIWAYFWLLILEGSVRKWIPSLSNPFLLVRDPIALMIWIQGARLNIVDRRYWWAFYLFALPVTLLGLVQAIVVPVPFLVFLFGWRSYVLHLPVIFVTASVLTLRDLRQFGKWILLITLPMTILMLMQYSAPSDSWLNRGASSDSYQLESALGHVRPAGTFSFITGPAAFMPLAGAFVLLGFSRKDLFPKWLAISAGIGLLILIPFSGSRTIALEMVMLLVLALIGALVRGTVRFNPNEAPKYAAFTILGLLVVLSVYQISFVQDGINTFLIRWNSANESEGGASTAIQNRGFGSYLKVFDDVAEAPFLGVGIGSASNYASVYRTGIATFTVGENAWEREINELGSMTGLLFIFARTAITVTLIVLSYRALHRGNVLSWYLLAGGVVNLLSGLLDQTTAQGFLIFSSALILAGLGDKKEQQDSLLAESSN
jgi:hypothetical protein